MLGGAPRPQRTARGEKILLGCVGGGGFWARGRFVGSVGGRVKMPFFMIFGLGQVATQAPPAAQRSVVGKKMCFVQPIHEGFAPWQQLVGCPNGLWLRIVAQTSM